MPEEEYEYFDVLMERMALLEKIEKLKNIRENNYTAEESKQYLSPGFQ